MKKSLEKQEKAFQAANDAIPSGVLQNPLILQMLAWETDFREKKKKQPGNLAPWVLSQPSRRPASPSWHKPCRQ